MVMTAGVPEHSKNDNETKWEAWYGKWPSSHESRRRRLEKYRKQDEQIASRKAEGKRYSLSMQHNPKKCMGKNIWVIGSCTSC